jgi:hypothetical protein
LLGWTGCDKIARRPALRLGSAVLLWKDKHTQEAGWAERIEFLSPEGPAS